MLATHINFEASLESNGAFDGFQDFQHRDLGRGTGEVKTAPGASGRADQARLAQILKDFPEEAFGNGLLLAEDIDHHHLTQRPSR
jgi:hypothetical protein